MVTRTIPPAATPPAQTSELDDLLKEVAAGGATAFGHLYDRVVDRVLRLASNVVRNRALAEEAAQEAMVQVWRQAPRFDPARGSALSWILTITHRRAVDAVRREERRAATELTVRPTWQEASADDTTDEVCAQWVVSDALDSLTALQRQAVELTHLGELTQPEAATRLAVPLGTLKTRVRDGMMALRRWGEINPVR